jgi:hypothetical protein
LRYTIEYKNGQYSVEELAVSGFQRNTPDNRQTLTPFVEQLNDTISSTCTSIVKKILANTLIIKWCNDDGVVKADDNFVM